MYGGAQSFLVWDVGG